MGMMVTGMLLSGYLKDALSQFALFAASGGLLLIGALLIIPLFPKNRHAEVSQN